MAIFFGKREYSKGQWDTVKRCDVPITALYVVTRPCEQHNEFLDRALVVPTVDNLGVEFFNLGPV